MTELVKGIKELLSNEDLTIDSKRDKGLNDYIVTKAHKELNGKHGGLSDDIVLSWARHFYLESQETIDKEIKSLGGVKKGTTSTPTSSKPKPQKVEKDKENGIKMYNDKGKVVKAVQESLFG